MKRFEIVRLEDDAVGQGWRLFYRGALVGTAGTIPMLRRWARSLWRDQYQNFLDWCAANGWEFPCTATHFFNRATAYAAASNADAADDHALIDALCRQGIGPDWRNDD